MNGLLELINDFVERLADPQYGVAVNDGYAEAMERVLNDEPELEARFSDLDREDASTFTPAGWWWFLNRAQSEGTRLPEAFLVELYDRNRSPLIRFKVIETALRQAEQVPTEIVEYIGVRTSREGEELARILVQIGSESARATFRAFNERWHGELRETASELLREADPETRAAWLS